MNLPFEQGKKSCTGRKREYIMQCNATFRAKFGLSVVRKNRNILLLKTTMLWLYFGQKNHYSGQTGLSCYLCACNQQISMHTHPSLLLPACMQ